MRLRILVAGGIGLAAASLGIAQFSIGPTITFDPTVAARILTEISHVMQTEANTLNTYNMLRMNEQMYTSKWYWRGVPTMILMSATPTNRVGETAGWDAAVNHGIASINAYGAASLPLRVGTWLRGGTNQSAHYASAEIGASSIPVAMSTVGTVRQNETSMAQPIANCAALAQSTAAATNTETAQLNQMNGCQALALEQSQAAISLDASRLELGALQAKIATDNQVEWNNMVTTSQQYAEQQAVLPGNMAATMESYDPR